MKFKYYITNLFEGAVEGTNDDDKASAMAESEDFFVVDAETGEWLTPGNTRVPVEEGTLPSQ